MSHPFTFRKDLGGVDAYTRHKELMASYRYYYQQAPSSTTTEPKSYNPEYDILKKHHRFIRDDDDDLATDSSDLTWEKRIAKKYYDKLFKEYAICDLKLYKLGKIALRWRTEPEVIQGKGQFVCASNRCEDLLDLKSWEVNFGYMEDGVKKNELVKVRLCPTCSNKLNHNSIKKLANSAPSKKRKRISDEDESSSDNSDRDDISHATKKKKTPYSEDNEHDDQDQTSSSVWTKPLEERREKTKEEEFEDYFADLLQ
ncbi:hypothetical protein DM01DRAFT_1369330 [Hesseltinella vesiculosa]|uniref:Folate-sensitive fragile site protein Fra10Ac1 n=1 Tax=Hesseltinella vesiculosa TaxID=101127 RepID=A0A1X2GXJ3_9FUNG|nr:hypothetical protein DM01DRAFT_1369330 [Hesseltinella vesiculosa]